MWAYLLQPSRQLAGKPPPSQPKHRKVLRADVSCGGRKMTFMLPIREQGGNVGADAEGKNSPPELSGTGLPHAPSAPAAVETAEPPGPLADVSSPPPSAAGPIDPWRSPAYCPPGPFLAETFC
ncbi:hypothetical protein AMECASPLE_003549 [Ameca splendens]|uniref:Uncharacterized protein n=1 Tax=Ameca splendens TaxID=208324 RepID=A0ABV0Y9Z8_9TELE